MTTTMNQPHSGRCAIHHFARIAVPNDPKTSSRAMEPFQVINGDRHLRMVCLGFGQVVPDRSCWPNDGACSGQLHGRIGCRFGNSVVGHLGLSFRWQGYCRSPHCFGINKRTDRSWTEGTCCLVPHHKKRLMAMAAHKSMVCRLCA